MFIEQVNALTPRILGLPRAVVIMVLEPSLILWSQSTANSAPYCKRTHTPTSFISISTNYLCSR